MLLRILSILFPLFAITALGYVIGKRRPIDLGHANTLNMDVFTPALSFAALASRPLQLDQDLPLMGVTLVVIVLCGLLGWLAARLSGLQPRTLVPPMMFNNCGNLGLPMSVLAFGQDALAPAVMIFTVSNVLHFSFGVWLLDHKTRLSQVWRVPSVLAAMAGLTVSLSGLTVWPPLLQAIRMLGDIAIPLMLLSLGVRLANSRIEAIRVGLLGSVLRPVFGLAAVGLVLQFVHLPAREVAMLVVFGALPPAVLNYMFAERYQQQPDQVASIVLIGNVVAVLVLPLALALALQIHS